MAWHGIRRRGFPPAYLVTFLATTLAPALSALGTGTTCRGTQCPCPALSLPVCIVHKFPGHAVFFFFPSSQRPAYHRAGPPGCGEDRLTTPQRLHIPTYLPAYTHADGRWAYIDIHIRSDLGFSSHVGDERTTYSFDAAKSRCIHAYIHRYRCD